MASYDNGAHWIKCNNEALGQLYAVDVDYQENYNVYGGMQDNGVWFEIMNMPLCNLASRRKISVSRINGWRWHANPD